MFKDFRDYCRRTVWRKLFAVALFSLAAVISSPAQTLPLSAAKPASSPAAEVPADPLGRTTPRGTVVGFIRAAQAENEEAVQYFQPPGRSHHEAPGEEHELAAQLLTVLNAQFSGALDSISNDPKGRLDDGLPPDQEVVGGSRGLSESFPLYLVRQDDSHGNKIWLISRQTLAQVPEVYDSLRFLRIEKRLPAFLVKLRPLGMPLWQWLATVLFVPVALFFGWLVAWLTRWALRMIRRARGLEDLPVEPFHRFGPEPLLFAALFHYAFVSVIGTSLLYRQYYQNILWVFLAFAFYWAVTRVTRRVSRDIWMSLTNRGRLAERSLVSLTRRVLDVVIFLAIALIVLRSEFNWDLSAALAGLGIGGLAIGLGAQKTFENLIGGIAILIDRALLVGDPCKIGDQQGVVEDIGLRSTRLRTENRTLVSIPNGTVATAVLENFRFRDKILSRQLVRLRYDLSHDHVRYALDQLRDMLLKHPKVEASTARVRVLKLGDNGIEVEIYAFIMDRDYGEYLAVQEDLILQVIETLERTGAAVALPTQTTTVIRDAWVDPEKAAAAKDAAQKNRESSPRP